jgi:enediyne biosynthesis protein E4
MVGCSHQQKNQTDSTLLRKLSSDETGIDFNNKLTETEDFNIIEYLYFYNGGGVAIGDINNDDLPDIYFSSNQSSNKLYLNRGDFHFEDITLAAGVESVGNWKTGVAMADINADGLLDIFSCGVGGYKKFDGQNQVFINQGNNTFVDRATALGLAFQGFSTQVAFLDYDQDGDIDIYLLNHSVHSVRSFDEINLRKNIDKAAGDKLYENQLVPSGKTLFVEVTESARIQSSRIGYGLGVGVSDLNQDGWPDIYVSNDFHESDYLYLNNKDKTFSQVIEKSMAHSSRFSMGNEIADINNDALPDIVTLDMLAKDEAVRKASAGEDPYEIFQYKLGFGYHVQLARNALQLNRGISEGGIPMFSDIAPFAGVEATDWSWAPLLADFDNDGLKDMFISNGIMRRPNDMDYINFIASESSAALGYEEYLDHLPDGKVADFFFRNTGNGSFEDVSENWIGSTSDFSNGAAYSDLDNDGDQDLVVNHVNQGATVYKNQNTNHHSLNIKLNGPLSNHLGIGTKVWVYDSGTVQFQENYSSRGFQSSVEPNLLFGLGNSSRVDSIIVSWSSDQQSVYRGVASGHVTFEISNTLPFSQAGFRKREKEIFRESKVLEFIHAEDDFTEFEKERLVPYSLSTQGPKISVGDMNGDGRDDLFIGGAAGQSGKVFIQKSDGMFRELVTPDLESDSSFEDSGSAIFDANADGWNDLMIGSGEGHKVPESMVRLYLNNKKGKLIRKMEGIPATKGISSVVCPIDFDSDGDQDVFIGALKVHGKYGLTPTSHVWLNDGNGNFSTSNVLPRNGSLGMVTSAKWVDLNQDRRIDLVVVGHWMPISVYIQQKNEMVDKTSEYGFSQTNGIWNCVTLDDLDKDGDLDILAGNAGLNTRLKASIKQPLQLFVSDIDKNGSMDQILSFNNLNKLYPFVSRDQLIKQVPSLKKKFLRYEDFKNVTIDQILNTTDSSSFSMQQAFILNTTWFENSKGIFKARTLPNEVQFSAVFSIATDDFDRDGQADFLFGGNLYAVQPDIGRDDSGFGQVALGDGKGGFNALPNSSGFFLGGEIRDIQLMKIGIKKAAVVGINNASVKVFLY